MRDMSGTERLDPKAAHSGVFRPNGVMNPNLRHRWFRETLFSPGTIGPLLCFLLAPAAGASSRAIPSVNGPLTIDGRVEEGIWKQAAILPMQSTNYPAVFPQGGETRALVRGQYLCLSARLPETGRVVARSTGENPDWWREDLVIWTVHFRAFGETLTISINPLGAYRVEASPLPPNLVRSTLVGIGARPRIFFHRADGRAAFSAQINRTSTGLCRSRKKRVEC